MAENESLPGEGGSTIASSFDQAMTSMFPGSYFDVRLERRQRRMAYARLRSEVTRIRAIGNTRTEDGAYHTTLVSDEVGDPAKLRVLYQRIMIGRLSMNRFIINQEGTDPSDPDSRRLIMHDYVVSAANNTCAWQTDEQHRSQAARSWALTPSVGTLLVNNVQGLQILTGSEYTVHFPRVHGYPEDLDASQERRAAMDGLTGVLRHLSEATYEPYTVLPEGL